MSAPHLVRVGIMGQIGRFSSANSVSYSQDETVICRTDRGLEVGSVICGLDPDDGISALDGTMLRKATSDDQLILNRIEKFRDRAFLACDQLIKDHELNAILVDVEHLFDGQSLFFYFLGDVPDVVHHLTDQLAETYEKKVRFRKFTETLATGCGPNCGTGESSCASGGCSSCSVRGACGTIQR